MFQSGRIAFSPSQSYATFSVKILDNPQWNVEGRMAVHLKLPKDSPPELMFGELSCCTVVILNDDPFPEARLFACIHMQKAK